MSLPLVPTIAEIQARLEMIFPQGLEMRQNLIREMCAKTVYVFLYGGMVEGSNRLLRPSHIYFYTEEQAAKLSDEERNLWLKHSTRPGFRPEGRRWYADTTREPIRDETIRYGLLDIGAVGKIPGVPTTSSKPIYFLKEDFSGLMNPELKGATLDAAIDGWQKKHLTPAARARMALIASGKVKNSDEVLVTCPDGTVAKLSPGPSSLITKSVVEEFAKAFLTKPALLWMSESGAKVRYQDDATAKAMGLKIDQARVLPDIILMQVGDDGQDTHLVFIEVVASDGPMNQSRLHALLEYVQSSGFPVDQCQFGTAFEDRAGAAFKKCLPQLAWGTFAWFRSEPNKLMWLFDEPIDITSKL